MQRARSSLYTFSPNSICRLVLTDKEASIKENSMTLLEVFPSLFHPSEKEASSSVSSCLLYTSVAHQEIDLKNPKTNRKNAGFTDEERGKMTELLDSGFTDSFRYFYPDAEGVYSWWSYRFKAREKNAGWRIDYFLVSDNIKDRMKSAKIHTDIYGSDHCPVELIWE